MSRMEEGQDEILESHTGFVDDGVDDGRDNVGDGGALDLRPSSSRFQSSPLSNSMSILGSILHLSAITAGRVLTVNLHVGTSIALGPDNSALRSKRMPQCAKWPAWVVKRRCSRACTWKVMGFSSRVVSMAEPRLSDDRIVRVSDVGAWQRSARSPSLRIRSSAACWSTSTRSCLAVELLCSRSFATGGVPIRTRMNFWST